MFSPLLANIFITEGFLLRMKPVLASYGCCRRLPQSGWHKTSSFLHWRLNSRRCKVVSSQPPWQNLFMPVSQFLCPDASLDVPQLVDMSLQSVSIFAYHCFLCGVPLLSLGHTFQHCQRMPKTAERTKPCIYHVFSYTNEPMIELTWKLSTMRE